MGEEKLWYCKSCETEFDPYADDVKIIREGSHKSLIEVDGRAHSLTLTTWKQIQRRRDLSNHALDTNSPNLYAELPPEASDGDKSGVEES